MNLINLAFINKFANSQSSKENSSLSPNYDIGNFEYPIMVSNDTPTVNNLFNNFTGSFPMVGIGLNEQSLNLINLMDAGTFSIAGNSYVVFGISNDINVNDIEVYICNIETNNQDIPYISSVEKINIDFDEVDLSNFFGNNKYYYNHFYGFYMPNLNGWNPKERAIPYKTLVFTNISEDIK